MGWTSESADPFALKFQEEPATLTRQGNALSVAAVWIAACAAIIAFLALAVSVYAISR